MAAPAIPASQIVNVIPSVLPAGGQAVSTVCLVLTNNHLGNVPRVPYGSVYSFPTALTVSQFFGATSQEAAIANTYFTPPVGAQATPGALLFASYNWTGRTVAYLRGASVAGLGLAGVQALGSGTIVVNVDGVTITSGTIALAGATSLSNAASLIQTGLGGSDAVVTGSIATTTLTVTAVASGTLGAGQILTGSGVSAQTTIISQLTGPIGGTGTYTVSPSQNVASTTITAGAVSVTYDTQSQAFQITSGTLGTGGSVAFAAGNSSFTGTINGTTLTVNVLATGAVAVGQVITGSGVTSCTILSGSGNTWTVSVSQTAGPVTMTGTGGTLSAGLLLTNGSGAIVSPGGPVDTPNAAMTALAAITQNYATFMTTFEPTVADKDAFSAWNSAQANRFAYLLWTTEAAVSLANDTTSSVALAIANNYSGTIPMYAPINGNLTAAFVGGWAASLAFTQRNGRTNLSFRQSTTLTPDVTSALTSANLIANGCGFYGTYGTSAQNTPLFYKGFCTGPFLWADAYINQIWLNSGLQAAGLTVLTSSPNIPYNPAGYGIIEAGLAGPIAAAVNFGAIVPGVALTALQSAEINAQVQPNAFTPNINAAQVIFNTGWFVQVADPGGVIRQARGSPAIIFWFADGGGVQQLTIASVDVQ